MVFSAIGEGSSPISRESVGRKMSERAARVYEDTLGVIPKAQQSITEIPLTQTAETSGIFGKQWTSKGEITFVARATALGLKRVLDRMDRHDYSKNRKTAEDRNVERVLYKRRFLDKKE